MESHIADASRVEFIARLNEVPSCPRHQLAAIQTNGTVLGPDAAKYKTKR
jgi:hypothetical protein